MSEFWGERYFPTVRDSFLSSSMTRWFGMLRKHMQICEVSIHLGEMLL